MLASDLQEENCWIVYYVRIAMTLDIFLSEKKKDFCHFFLLNMVLIVIR